MTPSGTNSSPSNRLPFRSGPRDCSDDVSSRSITNSSSSSSIVDHQTDENDWYMPDMKADQHKNTATVDGVTFVRSKGSKASKGQKATRSKSRKGNFTSPSSDGWNCDNTMNTPYSSPKLHRQKAKCAPDQSVTVENSQDSIQTVSAAVDAGDSNWPGHEDNRSSTEAETQVHLFDNRDNCYALGISSKPIEIRIGPNGKWQTHFVHSAIATELLEPEVSAGRIYYTQGEYVRIDDDVPGFEELVSYLYARHFFRQSNLLVTMSEIPGATYLFFFHAYCTAKYFGLEDIKLDIFAVIYEIRDKFTLLDALEIAYPKDLLDDRLRCHCMERLIELLRKTAPDACGFQIEDSELRFTANLMIQIEGIFSKGGALARDIADAMISNITGISKERSYEISWPTDDGVNGW